ncbi:MAG: cupredoxin domain-containing protein [Thermodesulfobacteriota bacterium]
MNPFHRAPALALAVLLLLAAPLAAAGPGAVRAVTGPDGVQRAEVEAGSYYFKPVHIIVKAGVPAQLTLRETSWLIPHNFVIDSPEAGMEVSVKLTRKTQTVRFVPGKPGKYPFYCDNKLLFLKSHRDKGMEGTIEVVE